MARYIDANKLIEVIEDKVFDSPLMHPVMKMMDLMELIEEQPTADVVEVVHGEWVDDTGQLDSVKQYKCSNCGKKPIVNMNRVTILSNYCPDCGAKMDGEKTVRNERICTMTDCYWNENLECHSLGDLWNPELLEDCPYYDED